MEKEKLKTKIEELNTINQEMSKSSGVDSKEFSEIQKELEELNKRWSALLKLINKELLRYEQFCIFKKSTFKLLKYSSRCFAGSLLLLRKLST